MKTEQQVREMRNEVYRMAILMDQWYPEFNMGELITALAVRLLDRVLEDDNQEDSIKGMLELLDKFKVDSRKLALY